VTDNTRAVTREQLAAALLPHTRMDEHSRAFWELSYPEDDNGCWPWSGQQNRQGYGVAVLRGRKMTAHRVAWLRSGHSIEVELTLDHLCRNKLCINPGHLEPVTRKENVLRGDTLPAANLRKTVCANGHPYSPENTIHKGDGSRVCRICKSDQNRRYQRPSRAKR